MNFPIYKFPLVPGPVIVPEEILKIYTQQFPSPDVEDEFFQLYS
jgi:hypothetical protein